MNVFSHLPGYFICLFILWSFSISSSNCDCYINKFHCIVFFILCFPKCVRLLPLCLTIHWSSYLLIFLIFTYNAILISYQLVFNIRRPLYDSQQLRRQINIFRRCSILESDRFRFSLSLLVVNFRQLTTLNYSSSVKTGTKMGLNKIRCLEVPDTK